jgi:hypothetical protein
MTGKDIEIVKLRRQNEKLNADLVYVLKNPLQGCKVCKFCDADCSRCGQNCHPEWRGETIG